MNNSRIILKDCQWNIVVLLIEYIFFKILIQTFLNNFPGAKLTVFEHTLALLGDKEII